MGDAAARLGWCRDNLDLRGRVAAGKDDMGGSAANRLTAGQSGIAGTTLGAAGGDERMHQHSHSASTDSQGAHTHTLQRSSNQAGGQWPGFSFSGTDNSGTFGPTSSDGTHSHAVTVNNSGSGGAQNVQPTLVLNYIIKV